MENSDVKSFGRVENITLLTKTDPDDYWSDLEISYLVEFLRQEAGLLPRVAIYNYKPNILVLETSMWSEEELKTRLQLRLNVHIKVTKEAFMDHVWILTARPMQL